MEKDQVRFQRMLEGINIWRTSKRYSSPYNGCGTLNYPPGFGKTLVGIEVIKMFLSKIFDEKFLVITPNRETTIQWEEEIAKEIPNDERIVIKSVDWILKNDYRDKVKLVIIDEIHKFINGKSFDILCGKYVKYNYILGLTATPPSKKEEYAKLKTYCPIIDTITLAEAKHKKWISNFIEYNLGLELPEQDRVQYDKFTVKIREILSMFNNNYDLIQACYSGIYSRETGDFIHGEQVRHSIAEKMGWNNNLDLSIDLNRKINEVWNPNSIYEKAKTFSILIQNRKDLLDKHENKIEAVKEVLTKFDLKTICFSQSTDFADRLCYDLNAIGIPTVKYHSNIKSEGKVGEDGDFIRYKTGAKIGQIKLFGKDTIKKDSIEAIKSGTARVISTGMALDEGFNVESIRLGITTSGSSNPIQYKQRSGRVMRIDSYAKEDNVLIINIYFIDTRDEQKLRLRQKFNSHAVTWINSTTEINFSY